MTVQFDYCPVYRVENDDVTRYYVDEAPECPACGLELPHHFGGSAMARTITCPGCGTDYDVAKTNGDLPTITIEK